MRSSHVYKWLFGAETFRGFRETRRWNETFGSALSDSYTLLISPNKDDTAVHGCHSRVIRLCACVR